MPYLLYFILGFLGSFLGTIPLGPINLSVVETTLKKGVKSAMMLALAAAIIELIYSFISFHCSAFLSDILQTNPYIHYLIAGIFILFGLLLFLKKSKPKSVKSQTKQNGFLKGLVIAALNPQAIPFWIFVISYYQMNHWIDMDMDESLLLIFLFVFGAAIGKIASLYLYSILSFKIAGRLARISNYMNKVIGTVLILIGLSQLF